MNDNIIATQFKNNAETVTTIPCKKHELKCKISYVQ